MEPHFRALKPVAAVVSQASAWQPRPLRRLVAGWMLPDPPPPVHWTRTRTFVSEVPEVTFEWVGDILRHVGTAVLTFLAQIARDGLERWDAATLRSRERVWRTVLLNLGVLDAEVDSASALLS